MSIDHGSLFKVFLSVSFVTIMLCLFEMLYDFFSGSDDILVHLILIPIGLALIMVLTLVSALVDRSRGHEVSIFRCGLYMTMITVLVITISFLTLLMNVGFTD